MGNQRSVRPSTRPGPIVVEGKVHLRAGLRGNRRESCYIAAHDARTGKEVWKFHTIPAAGEPGAESWGGRVLADNDGVDVGIAGSLRSGAQADLLGHRQSDAEHAHGPPRRQCRCDPDVPRRPISTAIRPSRSIPTPASSPGITSICPATTGTRITRTNDVLFRTAVNPDPKFVKWINPDIPRRPAARHRGEGRRRRRHLRARSGRPASFCGPRRFRTTRPIS